MASAFWKVIGSRIAETAVAAVQQVGVINELKRLPPEEARTRWIGYVQGLPVSARAGLAMTLTVLAKKEGNAATKRLIETLRASLVKPERMLSSAFLSSAAPLEVDAGSGFDNDLQRVTGWYELDDDQRNQRIVSHISALSIEALEALKANLHTMQENCAQNIKNHQENEARIVGGRFIEDQINYRLSRLATGNHDPRWLQQLHDMEDWAQRFAWLHQVVSDAIGLRRTPEEPPPAPVQSESDPPGEFDPTDSEHVARLIEAADSCGLAQVLEPLPESLAMPLGISLLSNSGLDFRLMGLNIIAEQLMLGNDPERSSVLARATLLAGYRALGSPMPMRGNIAESIAYATHTIARIYEQAGLYDEIIALTDEIVALVGNLTDGKRVASLRICSVDALMGLGRLEAADLALAQLEAEGCTDTSMPYVRERLNKRLRSVTELADIGSAEERARKDYERTKKFISEVEAVR